MTHTSSEPDTLDQEGGSDMLVTLVSCVFALRDVRGEPRGNYVIGLIDEAPELIFVTDDCEESVRETLDIVVDYGCEAWCVMRVLETDPEDVSKIQKAMITAVDEALFYNGHVIASYNGDDLGDLDLVDLIQVPLDRIGQTLPALIYSQRCH